MGNAVKSYKGFNKDMTCSGFQYEEGKEYEEESVEVCDHGFHACEYPLDCLNYYSPNESVYHEVEQSGKIQKHNDYTKVASTKIKIGAEISIAGLVKAAIEYTVKRVNKEAESDENHGASSATGNGGASSATGDYGASSATGNCGASSATGDYGASSATGYCGASSATGYKGASSATGNCGASSATGYYGASSATGYKGASSATGNKGASSATGNCGASSATGYYGASSATGDYGASSATGNYGASSATGYKGASSATGDYGASSATGNCGASSATGYYGASSAEDKDAVAVAWGYKSKAKGVLGAFLVFADWEYTGSEDDTEYDRNNQSAWVLNGAKMVQVDGENIKPNTWYTIENGEIAEVSE
jgi:hypothetical protein